MIYRGPRPWIEHDGSCEGEKRCFCRLRHNTAMLLASVIQAMGLVKEARLLVQESRDKWKMRLEPQDHLGVKTMGPLVDYRLRV